MVGAIRSDTPLVEVDGWQLFLRGEPNGPWPKRSGDVYAIAPDRLELAIAWESDGPALRELAGPSPGRCGVFQVLFPVPVMCKDDIADNFREVLPILKACHARRSQNPVRGA